ncbi:PepSY domain-containing protein [Coralliovum pocilloporae]|uniref:PepSY domain-containing protein n=1 Tax=Coralliovum pocilloporae TaxID=3066369 RepID=UPI003307AF5D
MAVVALSLFAVTTATETVSAAPCLSQAKVRQLISSGQALPFSKIKRSLRGKVRGKVVKAELCAAGGGLVYVLTVLTRSGKVSRLRVDARNGSLR